MQLEEEAMADAFENYEPEVDVAGQQDNLTRENTHLSRESSNQWISKSPCYICGKGSLSTINQDDLSIWECSNCHRHFTQEGIKLLQQHSETCPGNILCTQNSPEDVIILCTVCELCAAL
jgi:Zn-finger protein